MMRKAKVIRQGGDYIIHRRSFLFIVPLAVMLVALLAACGSNGGTGSAGGTGSPGSTPTAKPTSGSTASTPEGCPSTAAAPPSTPKPNITLVLKDSNTTITAHTGDLIEVRLPFGHQWTGPTTSQGVLQLQAPAGYALKPDNVCVWHFVAQGTGTTRLTFTAKAICKPGQMCPLYILQVPYTIEVK